MEACGICGSDVMDWYTQRKAPAVLGHEPVGVVIARGPSPDGNEAVSDGRDMTATESLPAVGDRVFIHHHVPCFVCRHCLSGNETLCAAFRRSRIEPGGFSELIVVPAENARRDTLVIPDHVSFESATLIEPLACVLRGHRKARGRPGGITAVIGLGQIGLLHVMAVRRAGTSRVAALDPVSSRLERAERWGAIPVGSTTADFRARFGAEGAAVIHVATSAPSAIETALEIVDRGGVIQLFAPTAPDTRLSFLPNDFFFRELTLRSTYSAGPADTREALSFIAERPDDFSALVTHRFPLDEVQAALEVQARDRTAVKVIISASVP
jgi:L-iditol 2-dehydrogenase